MTDTTEKTPRKKLTLQEKLHELHQQTSASLERIRERERVAREKLTTLIEARVAAEQELERIRMALGQHEAIEQHADQVVHARVAAQLEAE